MATEAPSRPKATAMALPIPREEPVTTATLFSSCTISPSTTGKLERAVDQRQVGKRLWKVAYQPLCPRIVLFAQQAHVVAQREQPLEELHGLVSPAYAPQRVDHPEAADQERTLAPREAVVGLICPVSQDEAVFGQFVADGLYGTDHPLVVVGQEPDARDEQRARVEHLGAVRLGEGTPLCVVAFLQDVGVDLIAHGPPAVHRSLEPEALDACDEGAKRHPAHDL